MKNYVSEIFFQKLIKSQNLTLPGLLTFKNLSKKLSKISFNPGLKFNKIRFFDFNF